MTSAFSQPTKFQHGLPGINQSHASPSNPQVSFNNERFQNQGLYSNQDQKPQIITLPYGMMIQQQSQQGNRLLHPQQFFVMSQNSDPYLSDTYKYLTYPMLLAQYNNQPCIPYGHQNLEKVATNMQGQDLSHRLLINESPPALVNASQSLLLASDLTLQTNKISGLPSYPSFVGKHHQSINEKIVEEAAIALLNASRLSQTKLVKSLAECDQKIVSNLNSQVVSNNRLVSENQKYQVLSIQEKGKTEIQDKSFNKVEVQHQKSVMQNLAFHRSPSIISTQCDSLKRKTALSEELQKHQQSPESSYSTDAQVQPADILHFTNHQQHQKQVLRHTMFSQQKHNRTKSGYKNNHLLQNSASRIEGGRFYLSDVLILEKILDSDNLNECVSIILNKERNVTSTKANISSEITLQLQASSSNISTCISKRMLKDEIIHKRHQQISPPHKFEQDNQFPVHRECDANISTIQEDEEALQYLENKQKNDMKTRKTFSQKIESLVSNNSCQQQLLTLNSQENIAIGINKGINEDLSIQNSYTCQQKTVGFQSKAPITHRTGLHPRKTLKVMTQQSNLTNASKILQLKPQPKSLTSSDMSGDISSRRHRQRKNDDQHNYLMCEFAKNPNWDKPTIQRLAQHVGLKMSQIYKWNWDQQKKIRHTSLSQNTQNVI